MAARAIHIGCKAIAVLFIAIAACCVTESQALAADYSYKSLETLGLANNGAFHPGEVWTINQNEYSGRNFYPITNNAYESGFKPNTVSANTKYNSYVLKLHSSVDVWDGWIVAFWMPATYTSYGGLWSYFNSGNSLSGTFAYKGTYAAVNKAVCAVCPPAGIKMVKSVNNAWDYSTEEITDGAKWIWLDSAQDVNPICAWGSGNEMTVEVMYTDNSDFTGTNENGDIVTPVFTNAQGYAATTDNGFIASVLGRIESSLKGLANEMLNQNANSDSNWEDIQDAQDTTNDKLTAMQTTMNTISSRINTTNTRLNTINTSINNAKTAITDALGDGVNSIVSAIGDMDIGVDVPGLPTFGQSQYGNGEGTTIGNLQNYNNEIFKHKAPFAYYDAIMMRLQYLYTDNASTNFSVKVPIPFADDVAFDMSGLLNQKTGQSNGQTIAQLLRNVISMLLGVLMLFASAYLGTRTFLGGE